MGTQTQDNIFPGDRPGGDDSLPLGAVLRRARQHYNLSLADVAAALRIRATQIGALEDGRFDLLPGRVYAIGYVRAYAEYLGLDGDRMVHLYKVQVTEGGTPRPGLHFPAPASESKGPGPWILGAALASMMIVAAGAMIVRGFDRPEFEIPPVREGLARAASIETIHRMPLTVVLENAIERAAGSDDPANLMKPESRIVLTAVDSVWVEVRDGGGKILISRILKKGDSFSVPDQPGMVLDTGNAGLLALMVDGKSVPPIGASGDIRRGVALDPDLLKKTAAAQAVAAKDSESSVDIEPAAGDDTPRR